MMGVLVETDQSSAWIPPPKKKWIRHYLLSEVPKDYKTFAALQNSSSPNTSNRGSSLPPPPPPPPPAASSSTKQQHHNHIYNHVNGVNNHVSTSSPPRRISPPPSHYASVPHDGSYLAARLTAPQNPPEIIKNNHHTNQLASPPNSSLHQSIVSTPNSTGSGGTSSSPGDISPHELKRRIGAGTREVHNKLEKNRRAHLKECFELLRRQLPSSHDDKKPSNLSVLHSAIRYIQSLKRKERDYEHEMERLAREKIACQQRLSSLKKELSAQWDHIDFAALLPEAPPPATAVTTNNTNSSSARASRTFDSDEDFEFEEIEEEIRRQRPVDISPQHSASTSTASERGHPSDVEDLTMSSRPGSSRDLYSSPPPPAPSLSRLSEQTSSRPPMPVSLAAELMRTNVSKIDVIAGKSDRIISRHEMKQQHPEDNDNKVDEHRIQRPTTELTSSTKLQVATSHLQVSPHLVAAPGLVGAAGTTIVGPTIQLLTTPSLRMLSSGHEQHGLRSDDGNKTKLISGFISPADASSRLPGGAEINVIATSPASVANSTATLVRSPVKPINLSTSCTSVANSKVTSLAHPLINGSVISHAPASLHRPPLSSGANNSNNGTTVLTTMHGTPTVVGTHHLNAASGITHVVTTGGGAQFSTLAPLVATGPVTMVTPGNHHAGVHILATHTGKPPFQVVSGPLLKTHQVVPAQYLSAATTAQLVKPVMMVSSAGQPSVHSVVTRTPDPSAANETP